MSVFFNGTLCQFTVPSGNYNILTLTSTIQSLMQASILSVTGRTVTTSWTYSSTTSFVTFSYLTCSGSTISGNNIQLSYNSNVVLMKMLGWTAVQTCALGSSVTSNQNVNVNPTQNLYIRSDTLGQDVKAKESLLEKDVPSDIIANVAIAVSPGSYIQYQGLGDVIPISNTMIDSINIYLSDSTSYLLNTQLLDWSFTLVIEEVMPSPDASSELVHNLPEQDTVIREQELKRLAKQKENLIEELKTHRDQLKSSLNV